MKKQDFLNDVEHEIKMLKKYGTKDELANMDLASFDSEHEERCVYGQMTGDCTSKRAKVLMDKSCIRVFNKEPYQSRGATYSEFKSTINGVNAGQGWADDGFSRNYSHSSALEGYILMKDAKIKMIVNFLKGDSNKLKL